MEGTNKAHENGEAMGFVGVRLTAQLGDGFLALVMHLMVEPVRSHLSESCFWSEY